MRKKFAYLLMGNTFDPDIHTAKFETELQITYIFTVSSFEKAKAKAVECANDGFGVIELCGAFGEGMAREIIQATGGRLGVGYTIHLPEQDGIFDRFFSS